MKIKFYYILTCEPVGNQHSFLVDFCGVVYEDINVRIGRRNDIYWEAV